MLSYLGVENFVFIDQLSLNFKTGMTALTGETGAGKSILCDALWLVLGAASDKNLIQPEKSYCRVEACFDVNNLRLKQWLSSQGYSESLVDIASCRVIRHLPRKGYGQVWINGKIAKLSDLKILKESLVARHSQHEQQRLLNAGYQSTCLDHYGGHIETVLSVEACYKEYRQLKQRHLALLNESAQYQDKQALLAYQLTELEESQLPLNEFEVIEHKQRQLAHANQILEKGQAALMALSEDEPINLNSLVQTIQQLLQKVVSLDTNFESVYAIVVNLGLEVKEADTALRYALTKVVVDPEQLAIANQKLEQFHRLARKHNINVQALPQLKTRLKEELKRYIDNQTEIENIQKALQDCLSRYKIVAKQLSDARKQAASDLETAVTHKIQSLGMLGGKFKIKLIPFNRSDDAREPNAFGNERVIFYLSAAPNQPLQSLEKNASGGELSRLSLVIQTLIAGINTIPTLIFDEIDTGVGGRIAEKMGHLLKELSKTQQVLCITHLPQIAVLAQHHYVVKKQVDSKITMTEILNLQTQEARVQEIARMLGGTHLKDQTLAYAKLMLLGSEKP